MGSFVILLCGVSNSGDIPGKYLLCVNFLLQYVTAWGSVEKDALRTGEENRVVFFVDNPGWLCALRSTWFLETGNSFYETFDSHRLVLSIPPSLWSFPFCLLSDNSVVPDPVTGSGDAGPASEPGSTQKLPAALHTA